MRWNSTWILIGSATAALLLSAVFAVLATLGDNQRSSVPRRDVRIATVEPASVGLAPTPETTPILSVPTQQIVPTAVPNPTGVSASDRLIIRKIGVNAPLSYKRVGEDGAMPDPTGADDVAIYDFGLFYGAGGTPGLGGNTVFSGHVDYGRGPCKNGTVKPPCEAVFWDLYKLRTSDEIEVNYGGGSYRYRVNSHYVIRLRDWAEDIIVTTKEETITLITCAGDFNRSTREYDSLTIVTAVRIN